MRTRAILPDELEAALRGDLDVHYSIFIRIAEVVGPLFAAGPMLDVQLRQGVPLEFTLQWEGGPRERDVRSALTKRLDLGPVRVHLDRRWSNSFLAEMAATFEQVTGVPSIALPPRRGEAYGGLCPEWAAATLQGRELASWFTDFLVGRLEEHELPLASESDLRRWAASGTPAVREGARRALGSRFPRPMQRAPRRRRGR